MLYAVASFAQKGCIDNVIREVRFAEVYRWVRFGPATVYISADDGIFHSMASGSTSDRSNLRSRLARILPVQTLLHGGYWVLRGTVGTDGCIVRSVRLARVCLQALVRVASVDIAHDR